MSESGIVTWSNNSNNVLGIPNLFSAPANITTVNIDLLYRSTNGITSGGLCKFS